MRLLTAIAVCLGFTSVGIAEPLRREPYNEAVDRGLEYLASQQGTDGAWTTRPAKDAGGFRIGKDPAITSLCVMAFLSAGHVPGEGPYGKVVENGIKYILSLQQPNGLIVNASQSRREMYHHGICTLMLAEAVGMLPDRADVKRLRKQLELAVKVILKAQLQRGEHRGGWRYQVTYPDADLSVTGWQLMALRAAKNVGCDVPAEPIDLAVDYVNRCYDSRTGGFRYQHQGITNVTIPCTGVGILSLELSGKEHHRSPKALNAGDYLLTHPLDPNWPHFFYGVYYTSQAMFQLGDRPFTEPAAPESPDKGNYWTPYRERLHKLLLVQKKPLAAGCWIANDDLDSQFGPSYCTAMAILALTVDYRFLPIYQRGEESTEKK